MTTVWMFTHTDGGIIGRAIRMFNKLNEEKTPWLNGWKDNLGK